MNTIKAVIFSTALYPPLAKYRIDTEPRFSKVDEK
jgi:hypothetical protein